MFLCFINHHLPESMFFPCTLQQKILFIKIPLLKTINEINNKEFIENIPNLYNPQYQVVNNYPAIISAEQFEQVIQEIKRRSNVSYDEYGKAYRKESKYSSKVKDH